MCVVICCLILFQKLMNDSLFSLHSNLHPNENCRLYSRQMSLSKKSTLVYCNRTRYIKFPTISTSVPLCRPELNPHAAECTHKSRCDIRRVYKKGASSSASVFFLFVDAVCRQVLVIYIIIIILDLIY